MSRMVFAGVSGAASAALGRRPLVRIAVAFLIVGAGFMTWVAAGGAAGAGNVIRPLSTMPVPRPANETTYIKSRPAAVKLGKALFWDMQAGSDGRTACATCHFNAGADNRATNQINPRGGSFTLKGPNARLTADDFPLHKLSDPNDPTTTVSDTSNVAGSQGVLPSVFDGVTLGDPVDDQTFATSDPDFKDANGTPVRRSTGRNTPSVINAVFNFRNFWDGRAQNDFNGVSPFGSRDVNARVGRVNAAGGVDQVNLSTDPSLHLENSSLASQAVGPPGNPVEMSADGRTLSDIGHKLLSVQPLHAQIVSPDDSVLGANVGPIGRGLNVSYESMIEDAFQPQWWNSADSVPGPKGQDYSLTEFNFPLFWGLAIQAYEATLVSDQTPVDRFLSGDENALSPAAVRGRAVFEGNGECLECHRGPGTSTATVLEISNPDVLPAGTEVGADIGFNNIGVRPTSDDPGVGGSDPFGNPLSITRLPVALGGAGDPGLFVDGAFKVPQLRNVELTAPYFHNGGELTLRQVVDFYSRGGDFLNRQSSPALQQLNLSDQEKDDLVEFLKALTDPRVKDQSAPFDHPELFVPSGEKTDASGNAEVGADGRAVDCFTQVPATGAAGGAPLARFPNFDTCVRAPDLRNPPAVPRPIAATPVTPVAPAAGGTAPTGTGTPTTTRRAPVRCAVPRLRGRTVRQARRALRRAHCRLGTVVRPITGTRGRLVVVRQAPNFGARRRAGTRVTVRLNVAKKQQARRAAGR